MEPDTARSCFVDLYRQADTDRERQVPYRTIHNTFLQPPRRTLWVLLIKEATKRGCEAAIGDTVDLGVCGQQHTPWAWATISHTPRRPAASGIVERGGRIRRLMPVESLGTGFAEQIDKIPASTRCPGL